MFTESERYYRSSGAVPIVGLLLAVGATLGAVVVLGSVYAAIDVYSPIIYLNIGATLGYGIIIGQILKPLLVGAMVRNQTVLLATAVIVGLTAVYTAWVAYIWLVARRDGFDLLIFSVPDLFVVLGDISKVGLWELKGGLRPTGLVLQAFWLVEAIIIMGGIVAPFLNDDVPFCERCSKWSVAESIPGSFAHPEDAEALRRELEDERYAALRQEPFNPDDSLHGTIHACPNCDDRWLTLSRVVFSTDQNGNLQSKVTPQIKDLVISKGEADKLLALRPTEIEDDQPQEPAEE